MTSIMRWFHHDGRRFRAWFRTHGDVRELVIASGDREVCTRNNVAAASLDELSDELLADLASQGRASAERASCV